jgi:hypothetical protein
MRSDGILADFQKRFAAILALPGATEAQRVAVLRAYLSLLNEFLYERRSQEQIDCLNQPDAAHPEWRRVTPFLAIWDDYAEKVLGFHFDANQIDKLAKGFVCVFSKRSARVIAPHPLPASKPAASLGGLKPQEFALLRTMHALQDFSQLPGAIDGAMVSAVQKSFGGAIPDEDILSDENAARKLQRLFGDADRNVDERVRYIFSGARIIKARSPGGAYAICAQCEGDVRRIFRELVQLPGLKRKKAYMILRDFHELGIWQYNKHIEEINIIPDNRIMRVALRTGILRPALGKLLNSLLDEFDFQYGLTTQATEESFRLVWDRMREINGGSNIVPYPAGLDQFVFRLADGRGGCCKPGAMACKTGKTAKAFFRWLADEFDYTPQGICPLIGVCPGECKALNSPFAIQNMTWMEIFTGSGGGGGLRGV